MRGQARAGVVHSEKPRSSLSGGKLLGNSCWVTVHTKLAGASHNVSEVCRGGSHPCAICWRDILDSATWIVQRGLQFEDDDVLWGWRWALKLQVGMYRQ